MALWGHLVKVNSSLSVLLKRWGGEEVAALFRGCCYLPVALGRPLGAFLPPAPSLESRPVAQGSWGCEGQACVSHRQCESELFPRPGSNYSWMTNYPELSDASDLVHVTKHEAMSRSNSIHCCCSSSSEQHLPPVLFAVLKASGRVEKGS